jgi:Ca2+-binding RTX toxin-like protein
MDFITPLESRILLASVNISGGIVNFTGGSRAEQFTLSPVPGTNQFIIMAANFSGTGRPISKMMEGPVKRVRVEMLGGNDLVVINTGRYRAQVTVEGGAGNDEIGIATRGACVLVGGAGNDSLTSGSGDDLLDGGSGDDSFEANDGKDTLIGGLGYDVLRAGAGDDILYGKDGATDTFFGGPGQDIAKADKGPRRIVGVCACDYANNPDSKESFMRNGQIESLS